MSDGMYLARAGAIPYRLTTDGRLEVLLITNRDGQWGIPKGFVDPAFTAAQTAANESMEEAGVEGELSARPVGACRYSKYGRLCLVEVFALRVTRQVDDYDECRYRRRTWCPVPEALCLVEKHEMRSLIERCTAEIVQSGLPGSPEGG